jgi:hypothetical protein
MVNNNPISRWDYLGLLPDTEYQSYDSAVSAAAKTIYDLNLKNIPAEHHQHFTSEAAFNAHKADVFSRLIPEDMKGIPQGAEYSQLYQFVQKKYFGQEYSGVIAKITKSSGTPPIVWVIEYGTNGALSYVEYHPVADRLVKKYEKLHGVGCVKIEAKMHNHPTGGPPSPGDMENKSGIRNYLVQPWGAYNEY